MNRCPYCDTVVVEEGAIVCPVCGTQLTEATKIEDVWDKNPDWFEAISDAVSGLLIFPHCKLGDGFAPYVLSSEAETGCILIWPVSNSFDLDFAAQNLEKVKAFLKENEPGTHQEMVLLLNTTGGNTQSFEDRNIHCLDKAHLTSFAIDYFSSRKEKARGAKLLDDIFKKADEAWDKEEYEMAFSLYKKLSDSGYVKAYGYLGLAYELGNGTQRDMRTAELYYKKAIAAHEHIGVYRLGMLYRERGQCSLAYEVYQHAIDEGFAAPNDYFHAAQMLEEGRGVKRNTAKAIEYYWVVKRARESTIDVSEARRALDRLGALYDKGSSDLTSRAEVQKKRNTQCPKCKSAVDKGYKFCPQCGANLIEAATTDFLVNILATAPAPSSAELEKMKNDPVVRAVLKEMERNRKQVVDSGSIRAIPKKDQWGNNKGIGGFFRKIFK